MRVPPITRGWRPTRRLQGWRYSLTAVTVKVHEKRSSPPDRHFKRAKAVIDRIVGPKKAIRAVHFVDVRQSMRNGGGPACLRLRVNLTDAEASAMHDGVLLTDALYHSLRGWIEKHYREHLSADDL